MSRKFSIWKGVIALGVSILFAISGQAMATTTDLGVQSAPASLTFGGSFLSQQTQFYDDYLFTMSPGSVDTVASTISLGSLFGINNLQARLYSGTVTTTGKPTGLLEAWSTAIQITGNGYTGSMAVISPITLGAGSYVLEIRGDVVGTAGGSYAGALNISPVPEPQEWALLLAGLGVLGFVALGRKRRADGVYGMYA